MEVARALKVLGVGALLALGGFLFLRFEERVELAKDVPPGEESRLEPVSSAVQGQRESSTVDSPALLGRVVTEDGSSIPGALVRWLPVRSMELEEKSPWGRIALLCSALEAPLVPPEREAAETHSDSHGEFRFALPAWDPGDGSILVASAQGYRVGGLELGPGLVGPVELRLDRGPEVLVRVIDDAGVPVSGALVQHIAGGSDTLTDASQRFLCETGITDKLGEARFIEFPGRESFQASHGERRSSPWIGETAPRIDLRLQATFRVAGSVTLMDRNLWGGAHIGEHTVEVAGRSGHSWRSLALARDVDGDFGPLEVPLLPGAIEYRVRLDGAPLLPVTEYFAPPTAGRLLRFDFRASKSEEINLVIQDTHQRPIAGARGVATWVGEDGRIGHKSGVSGPQGYLYLGSLPPGTVRYQVSARGYGEEASTTQVPLGSAPVVVLREGSPVVGRVTLDGSPVSDFEVLYSRNDNLYQHQRKSFYDREDGSFDLSLGAGEWLLRAATAMEPASSAESVRVAAGMRSQVEIRLERALLGGGVVLDSTSSEPIAGARIQALSGDGRDRTLTWGEPALSSADGSFELTAFSAGRNVIAVSAPGHAEALLTAQATSDGFVDWGEVRLSRPQRLEILAHGYDELGLTHAQVSVFSAQGYVLAPKTLDSDGFVAFDEVPPGEIQMHVGIDGYYARLDLNLVAGEEWSFEVGLGGARTVSARLFDEEGKLYETPFWMLAGGNEFGHYVLRMDGTAESGRYTLGGIGTEVIDLVALADDGRVLASKPLDFDGQNGLEVDLHIEERPLEVHVIDSSGAPIGGTSVRIRAADENRILSVGKSSGDGSCSLAGAPHAPVIVDLDHPELGRRFGVPIDASVRRHEVVLEASGSLTLRILDGDEALGGIETRFQTPDGTVLAAPLATGGDGTVRHSALGTGSYRIHCAGADVWPVSLTETLSAGEEKHVDVSMRRLADVELVVLDTSGLPVAGVPIRLTSSEFRVDVALWLEEQKLSSDTGLMTDLTGRARLEGLPHGNYSWSVASSEAESTGMIRLTPGKNVRNLALQH